MKALFSRKAFQYFEAAKKNKKKKDWYKKNQDTYFKYVKEPMTVLLRDLEFRLSHQLPNIAINPRKIARPLRSRKQEAMGFTRASTNFFLAEKQTSIFEWNPGLFFQLGDEKADNMIGMGLYGPSSRQIKRLRKACVEDYATLDRILADKKLKKYWGGLADEKYKRFPKDYSPDQAGAKYLWYKQFFLRRNFTRTECTAKDFEDTVLKAFEAGLPLFQWIRDSIGVYDRLEMEQEKRDRLALKEEQELRL